MNLPEIKQKPIIPEHFPTAMQAFIFRNWESVPKEKIAKVIGTTPENVTREALRMGLSEQCGEGLWLEKGYISIIRANWHLLPYSQLLELLSWDEERLARALKEDDFLDVKLGYFKPDSEPILYRELTEDEIQRTEYIKAAISDIAKAPLEKEPFLFDTEDEPIKKSNVAPTENEILLDSDFGIFDLTGDETAAFMAHQFKTKTEKLFGLKLDGDKKRITLEYTEGEEEYHTVTVTGDSVEIKAADSAGIQRALTYLKDEMQRRGAPILKLGKTERKARFGVRMIYPFSALYEGALDTDSSTYCSDALLEKYAECGVNGIWLQAVLYRLIEFPYMPSLSDGWQERQENLRNFINRSKKYGIKIYLYINEPRTVPLSIFEEHPDMKGAVSGAYACMCLSSKKSCDYLSWAVSELCRGVPDIGGFFTITMSENLTHCKARESDIPCPRCRDTAPWELAAKANRIIAEAAAKVNPAIKVIAWDWAWGDTRGFSDGDVEKCIEAIPESVSIMSKRETRLPYTRGGVTGAVDDYTLSVDGISKTSLDIWQKAKRHGHRTAAKLQINNTWECSTVPYLPIYRTLGELTSMLIEADVNDLMLSWTLGGYPSPNIKLISEGFFKDENDTPPDYDRALRSMYGESTDAVKRATDIFCEAFHEFPFSLDVLYNGPQNAGPSNLLYPEPTGYTSTMTCYAYDDLKSWRAEYTEEAFEEQFRLLSERWKAGIAELSGTEGEIADMAFVSYSLFRSSYNQVRFTRRRNEYLKTKDKALLYELTPVIEEERELAEKLYSIMSRLPSVGFEAANHYYISRFMMLEKIINCDFLKRRYEALLA